MSPEKKGRLIVLAIGGNSLIRDPKHQTVPDQYDAVEITCQAIADLVKAGHRVVITHGNGPQVGFILRRAELAQAELHMVPLDSCGADTQGAIGYQIQRAMYNVMRDWPEKKPVATVVTQTRVDAADPAFQKPSKPIGSFMDQATARSRREKDHWTVVEDAGRGWRRVVASPRPREVIEIDAIRALIEQDFIVVAAGGGGIPVVLDEHGILQGSEAVIDKDLATSLLARQLGADLLIISTAVDRAALNFGKPDQVDLERMTVAEARRYLAEGHFKPGSMKPKIEAMIEFVEAGGGEALLCLPENVRAAVDGHGGTRLVP